MITVQGLTKEFKDFQALRGLDMRVEAGEVYGFIGQNGAGKTTTLNILAGLSRPTQGKCIVNGRDLSRLNHPGDLNIGYLPESPCFYPWLSAYETLAYLAGQENVHRISEILAWVGLTEAQHRRVGGFSRGMRQRLGIGATLIRDPQLFLLDEPSSALDPEGRSEVLRLIKDLQARGKTVLFSTHILDDVERICDRVGMIDGGRMVWEKPLKQLQKENTRPIFEVTLLAPAEPSLATALTLLPSVESITQTEASLVIRGENKTVSVEVMRLLAARAVAIESFSLRKARLEDLFLEGVEAE